MHTLQEIMKQYVSEYGINFKDDRIYLRIDNAKDKLREILKIVLGDSYQWHPAYDEIVQWLSNNHGKGLLLQGTTGLGKTLMIMKVLPILLHMEARYMCEFCNAYDLHDRFSEIRRMKIICLDDIGTEPAETKTYGNSQTCFVNLLDLAEKEDKLLLITTNLSDQELLYKYGERIDRLKSLVVPVIIVGEEEEGLKNSLRS